MALYLLIFIFGVTTQGGYLFYNEYRTIQVALLLLLALTACFYQRQSIIKTEILLFLCIVFCSFFWEQPTFIITDLLLFYLLYQCFHILSYKQLTSKIIVISSLYIFAQLPFTLWDYVRTGIYQSIWYPLNWNIRVYNSYFLIVSIFAAWYYLTKQAYRYLYLLFLFLAFFAVLLDGGRSVTISYTLFIVIVSITYRQVRWHLIFTYITSWLAYFSVVYVAGFTSKGVSLRIARESSSGRIDLWENAYRCWLQHPIVGCGFYQREQYPNLPAHPHNIFLQVLSETGLLIFGLLIYITFIAMRRIRWKQTQSYFVIAALLAIGVDLFFSGVHIYPVTQMALLWLFLFLLKNPEFVDSNLYDQVDSGKSTCIASIFLLSFYFLVSVWFIFLFIKTQAFVSEVPFTPPRFWIYGYQL